MIVNKKCLVLNIVFSLLCLIIKDFLYHPKYIDFSGDTLASKKNNIKTHIS